MQLPDESQNGYYCNNYRRNYMYKWNPEDYQHHSSAQEILAEGIISGLNVEGNEHILDIGCGDGKITTKLASFVPHGQVLGIDSSVEMVEFARNRFPSSGHANLRFEQMDVLDLKFESKFDLGVGTK
jgi:trans-aconitate 2-methyltransferase